MDGRWGTNRAVLVLETFYSVKIGRPSPSVATVSQATPELITDVPHFLDRSAALPSGRNEARRVVPSQGGTSQFPSCSPPARVGGVAGN
jgi:hypothetical protein